MYKIVVRDNQNHTVYDDSSLAIQIKKWTRQNCSGFEFDNVGWTPPRFNAILFENMDDLNLFRLLFADKCKLRRIEK